MKNMILSIFLPVVGVVIGFILTRAPGLCIELQKRAYALINWRVEPISMERELNNTRLMGFVLTSLSMVGLIFVLFK
jgi:hypothetical protein